MSDLARQVVSGFGFRWTYAEVAHVYPNDRQHIRLNIRGQRANAVLADARDQLHDGDWVMALGPNPETREWLIIGYAGTAAPGEWFAGDPGEVDYTQGNGPYAGTILPLGGWDSLWKLLTGSATDPAVGAHQLGPRQAPNDAVHGDDLMIVLGSNPTNALYDSYGRVVVPGDRIRLMRHLDPVFDPPGWCSLGETNDSGVTFLPGAHVGHRVWPGGAYQVGGGVCENADPSDLTTMSFGNGLVETHEDGFDIHLKLVAGAMPGELFYFKFAPFLSDKQFIIRYLGGASIAVGWTYAILSGTPAYPTAGNWTTFALPPTERDGKEDKNRQGETKAVRFVGYYDFTVSYRGNEDGTATVSIDHNDQSYDLTSWIWGGQLMGDWIAYAGNFRGYLMGSLGIRAGDTDQTFDYGIAQPPTFPRALPGEWAWHAHAYVQDPVDPTDPDGPIWATDPGDLLPDGLYLCILEDKWIRIAGTSTKLNSDEDWQGADNEGSSAPIYPDLSQLGGLDEDVLTQYANVDRFIEMAGDAGMTLDDLPDGTGRVALTAAEYARWIAPIVTADLSDQVDGIDPLFTLPSAANPDTLDVRLNSIPLTTPRDYQILNSTTIQIDVRIPVATSPKDRVTVSYRGA